MRSTTVAAFVIASRRAEGIADFESEDKLASYFDIVPRVSN
jgi:hypothetical protein